MLVGWKIRDGSYDAVMETVNGSIRDTITGIDGLEKCIPTYDLTALALLADLFD